MSKNKKAELPADNGKPVAWITRGKLTMIRADAVMLDDTSIPLYVSPRKQWVGLTDEQVEDEWERITGHSIFGGDRSEQRAMYISPDEVFEFSRAIEAKLKEKNV